LSHSIVAGFANTANASAVISWPIISYFLAKSSGGRGKINSCGGGHLFG